MACWLARFIQIGIGGVQAAPGQTAFGDQAETADFNVGALSSSVPLFA